MPLSKYVINVGMLTLCYSIRSNPQIKERFELQELDVVNNKEAGRFEMKIGDQIAFSTYRIVEDNIIFSHTVVPIELEGQGIGTKLTKTALDFALENELKIIPLCPFVAAYIRRNPEYIPFVVDDQPKEQA